jgi:tight adherence protein B
MIVVSAAAIFLALFLLATLALPQRRISKRRLGVERQHVNAGQAVGDFLERRGHRRGIAQALALADVKVDAGTFVLRVVMVAVLAGIGGLLVSPLLALVAFALPFVVARAWIRHKGSKRREKFAEQLPEALQMLITSLRSGFAINQAIITLTEEAEEPVRSEFAFVLTETRVGRTLADALRSLAHRMNSRDLDWVVSAIEINRETGGNLAEILENVNTTIRERHRIGRKVDTFTAEGRLSAKIMAVLPVLVGLFEWWNNPDGFAHFFSGYGPVFLGIAAALILMGTLWIRKIVSIKF